ncbi:DUF1538 family protein [Vibrio lentus]|nr:DUF1538 family protein [Vibrio lentus]
MAEPLDCSGDYKEPSIWWQYQREWSEIAVALSQPSVFHLAATVSFANVLSVLHCCEICIVVIQTFYAPKLIIPLAYDSGGVTTSTVTVPLVALGLGLASTVPRRNPAERFRLNRVASLFPIISVMSYAQITQWLNRLHTSKESKDAL